MSKKEAHKKVLADLLNEFLRTGDEEKIREYLISNSNLPGPRGNLELADVFAEIIEDYSTKNPPKIWGFASRLANVSANEAPVNSPKEFLPFCGVVAVGVRESLACPCVPVDVWRCHCIPDTLAGLSGFRRRQWSPCRWES